MNARGIFSLVCRSPNLQILFSVLQEDRHVSEQSIECIPRNFFHLVPPLIPLFSIARHGKHPLREQAYLTRSDLLSSLNPFDPTYNASVPHSQLLCRCPTSHPRPLSATTFLRSKLAPHLSSFSTLSPLHEMRMRRYSSSQVSTASASAFG